MLMKQGSQHTDYLFFSFFLDKDATLKMKSKIKFGDQNQREKLFYQRQRQQRRTKRRIYRIINLSTGSSIGELDWKNTKKAINSKIPSLSTLPSAEISPSARNIQTEITCRTSMSSHQVVRCTTRSFLTTLPSWLTSWFLALPKKIRGLSSWPSVPVRQTTSMLSSRQNRDPAQRPQSLWNVRSLVEQSSWMLPSHLSG